METKQARQTFLSDMASRYGQRLRKFFTLRMRTGVDASDLAQEVFLRLLRVQHYESIRNPEAYLFTVASHVLHQHTLRQASAPGSLSIAEMFAELQLTSDDDPMARADFQQRLDLVEHLLAQLPPKISSTLLLHRFAGLSIEEIGQRLGVSRAAAKKYLARALTQCREVLEEGQGGDNP